VHVPGWGAKVAACGLPGVAARRNLSEDMMRANGWFRGRFRHDELCLLLDGLWTQLRSV